jgi:hypothetical protein
LLCDRYWIANRQAFDRNRLRYRVLKSKSFGGRGFLAVDALRPFVLTLTAFRSGLVTLDSPLLAGLAAKS